MANYKTSWVQRLIEGAWQKTFAFAHAKTVYTDYANKKTLADKLSEIDTEIGNKANKTEIPTELPANGGNSSTVNGHTVNADVPENAIFTDTVYDYSALLGYDIYNLVSLKDATYPANKTWLSKDFIAPFDGYVFFMVQTDATSGAFTQVFKEDGVLISDNQHDITDFNTWGCAYSMGISKGKTYHFKSYNNTATAFNKVMLCIRKKEETPTEYIPYAPSNVALAEENTQQSTEMMDIKMLGWSVPKECPIQNEVNGDQFVQKVGRVDLGSLEWTYQYGNFRSSYLQGIVYSESNSKPANAYIDGYQVMPDSSLSGNKVFSINTSGNVYIVDTDYTDVSAFKSNISGKYLYYELKTPITTTIDGNEMGETVSDVRKETTVNLLKPTLETTAFNGVTFTNNGDGTYILDGTANSDIFLDVEVITSFRSGRYKLVGFQNPNHSKCFMFINAHKKDGTTDNSILTDISMYSINYIDNSIYESLSVGIGVRKGSVLNGNICRPMITTNLNATYDDFVPYTGDSGSLNGDVAEKAPKENPVFTGSVTVGSRLSDTNFGQNSFTNGDTSQARGNNSFATGDHPVSLGANSQSLGCYTLAKANQCAIGHFNSSSSDDSAMYGTTGTAFYIGNGDERTRSNAFRVDYDGTPYSKAGLNTTGADYAEFFEWEDGNENNEDRRGYFVTLDGKHIKIANEGDWILGIVSGFPAIIGNGDEEWKGRYIFDDFGCPVIEEFEYEEEEYETITNDDGEEEVITKKVKKTGTKWKEVPEYDPTQPYTGRMQRKEWSAVGMLGVLSVRDDGSCKVNGFCKLADGGIATASDTGYRVVKRATDNIVEVIFK